VHEAVRVERLDGIRDWIAEGDLPRARADPCGELIERLALDVLGRDERVAERLWMPRRERSTMVSVSTVAPRRRK